MSIAAETARSTRGLEHPDFPRLAEIPAEPRKSARPDLRNSVYDAAAYSIMVGMGETYVPAFALALGLSEIVSGMVATVPMLVGAVMQLATPWGVRRLGSHRRWVVICASSQAICLLVLPFAVLQPSAAFWIIYSATSLYWAASLSTGPAWSTWIESLVPRRVRARFFGRRARIGHACVLLGSLAAGACLEWGKLHQAVLLTFAVLFAVAALCRFGSAGFLARKSEPHFGQLDDRHVGWREMFSRVRGEQAGRLLIYLLVMQVVVQICGPYFVPYMLGQLKLSYLEFTVLVGLAYIGKCVFLPFFGRVAEVLGPRRLLTVTGVAVIPISVLWVFSQNVAFIALVQFFGGAMWGGYELAMLLMFFEAIPNRERTSLLTVYNLGNATAMVVGTLLGGAILSMWPAGATGYLLIFALSSVGRALTMLLLRRVPASPVVFAAVPTLVPAPRKITLRPAADAMEGPISPQLRGAAALNSCCIAPVEASQ